MAAYLREYSLVVALLCRVYTAARCASTLPLVLMPSVPPTRLRRPRQHAKTFMEDDAHICEMRNAVPQAVTRPRSSPP